MPGLAHRNDQFSNGSSAVYSLSVNGFWSKNRDDVSYNQLQKFWSELSQQARQELLRIDRQTFFEQARKHMYCSRCNGLLLEGFLQIVMYGKSLTQEGSDAHTLSNRTSSLRNQNNGGSSIVNGCQDEIQDPSLHPWGGLTTTREGSLTLMDCYLYSKSLKGLQIVFDGARARERERELLYPDACGGGGRGWISHGIVSSGRGHGTREMCALHTARLSCDTLVDFWSALGDETRQSLLRMKEEDFIERLVYRFDSKRFCRDCRRNVIREFRELRELRRIRRETRCTSWFCVPDTAFQYEVSDDTIEADWRQTFADTVGSYHHFEWAVGTSEGKCDILEFENVGLNGCVQVNGLELSGLSACFITLRACKLDGRCSELSVKAQALKGQQCVHCRLIAGDGYVTITKGESIRRFFEHAEEAEEEEDDDSMDKDGNELDGECSRPQKHAKSPELAREFLLDAATVIFKEQDLDIFAEKVKAGETLPSIWHLMYEMKVEKAFREGTARQNAHSIFVCLALKLLEERVHVACKEIITLEKQMKLLEEEEKEKREEEERKERRRTKEREKKLRRKERLKGKEKDKEKKCSESNDVPSSPEVSKEELSAIANSEQNDLISCRDLAIETGDADNAESPDLQDEEFSSECNTLRIQSPLYDGCDGDFASLKDGTGNFIVEKSKLSHRRIRFRKDFQQDMSMKWSDRRRLAVVSGNGAMIGRSDPRHYGDFFVTSSRGINGSNWQLRVNAPKSACRNVVPKYNEKFHCSNNQTNDGFDFHSCSCNLNNEYRTRDEQHSPLVKVSQEVRTSSNSNSTVVTSKQSYCSCKSNQVYMQESCGRTKSRIISGNNPSRDLIPSKKVWEPLESQKKYPRSISDSNVSLRSVTSKVHEVQLDHNKSKSSVGEAGDSGEIDDEDSIMKGLSGTNECCPNVLHVETEGSCSSAEVACEESGSPDRSSALNGSSDSSQSSASISDNCSSCLSEGDSNTSSSNHGHTESLTASDSEDACQQCEGREGSICIQNSLSDCHEDGMEKNQNANGEDLASGSLSGLSLDGAGSDASENTVIETSHNFDDCSSTTKATQPQSIVPPIPNHNVQYPVFRAPSAMGYYHQNPVSWPAAPPNGLMPFLQSNHYLYASPLGYEDPRFCLQYGALQQAMPLFNPATFPIYQPVARATGIMTEERSQMSKPASMQEHLGGSISERVAPPAANSEKPFLNGEVGHDHSAKSRGNNGSFSLFYFGGPVALSTGCDLNSASSNVGAVGEFSSKGSADHIEKDHACNMEAKEYNLFATSNSLRFFNFLK